MSMRWLLVPLVVCLAAAPAQAGLIPASTNVVAEGDYYRWTYEIRLPSDKILRTNDFFTIYDFAGYLAGSAAGIDGLPFTVQVNELGLTPPRVLPTDTTVPNLTFVYTGGLFDQADYLITVTALSLFGGKTDGIFTARSGRKSDGRTNSNITSIDVPDPASGEDPRVPEPASLLMGGTALALLVGWRQRRRKTDA